MRSWAGFLTLFRFSACLSPRCTLSSLQSADALHLPGDEQHRGEEGDGVCHRRGVEDAVNAPALWEG